MALVVNKGKCKNNLNDIIKEFVDSSRSTLDEKINNIILMLKSLKEENEKNISKITTFCEKYNHNLLINNNIIINQNLTKPKTMNPIDTETKYNIPKLQIKKNKAKILDKSKFLKKLNTSYLKKFNRSSNLSLNNSTLSHTLQNSKSKQKSSCLKKTNVLKPNRIIIKKLKTFRNVLLAEETSEKSSKKNLTVPTSITHSEKSKTSMIKFRNQKKLSPKENAILILSKSPILRLCEQIIFSRCSKLTKEKITIDGILNNHLNILENKILELKKEIFLCTERIKKPFTASKIADISLNFITAADEEEFKDYDNSNIQKIEKDYYYNFIKILYLLFNEKFNNKIDKSKLKKNLFSIILTKGFTLKDYLYFCYISNKKEKPNFVVKIDEINEIIKKTPNLLNINETWKKCRFISFSIYLIKEIVDYANNIKDNVELKLKAEHFLEIVIDKKNKTTDKLSHNRKIKKEITH